MPDKPNIHEVLKPLANSTPDLERAFLILVAKLGTDRAKQLLALAEKRKIT